MRDKFARQRRFGAAAWVEFLARADATLKTLARHLFKRP
jgi:hypothetical protein